MFVFEDLQYTGSSRNISECTQETNHFAVMSVGKFQLAKTSEDTRESTQVKSHLIVVFVMENSHKSQV